MGKIIIKEYENFIRKKYEMEQTLQILPKGYISKKTINDKKYYYLQNRVDDKIISKYLKENEVDSVKQQINLRNKYKKALPIIEVRLNELELAAKLINKKIYRYLILLKLSNSMDSLSQKQKESSLSFANSLNAIEGVHASKTVKQNIDKWKCGNESFISIFQYTLNKYGFIQDV